MAETQQSKSNQSSRWTLIDLFDFLIWAGIIFAGLALKVLDPVIIGWSILTIGVVGAITKGATLFVKYPILIFIEGLEYLCLAPIFSIGSVYSLDITLTNGFWLATIGAVIAGILVIRKYLGKENPLISLLYYIERFTQGKLIQTDSEAVKIGAVIGIIPILALLVLGLLSGGDLGLGIYIAVISGTLLGFFGGIIGALTGKKRKSTKSATIIGGILGTILGIVVWQLLFFVLLGGGSGIY